MRNLFILRGSPACVDKDTEYFNGVTWKPISEYSDGEKVLQYNPDGNANLVAPLRYIKAPCNDGFYHIINNKGTVNQVLTGNHQLAYISSKGNLNKKPVEEVIKSHISNTFGFKGKLINHFAFYGSYHIKESLLRLWIAISADGSLVKENMWRVRVFKDYKIKRMRELLTQNDIIIDERIYKDGSHNFYIPKQYGTKEFPAEFYNFDFDSVKVFRDEIVQWDGNRKDTYRTTIKSNADIAQFLLSQFGRRVSLYRDDRIGKGYCEKYTRKSICYEVRLTTEKYTGIDKKNKGYSVSIKKEISTDGYQYCFTVPSGYLVLRRNNIIFITGNCGKSTWVKENNLEPYTLSADSIRLMYQSPATGDDGLRYISQSNDNEVWTLLMKLLETRMSKGEFIVIDATHYKSSLISRYKDLVHKYRYRVNVVDFSEVSEEECLRRNANRDPYKRVPEETIRKMYACLHDDTEVKKSYKMITPEEASEIVNKGLRPVLIDDSVERIVVFGDIHGCYAPLQRYFEENPFNDNYCYIFCGDYTDRGIQNKQVLEFLLGIYKKPNVFLIEGNHECMHKGTDILTNKGWVNIADIVEKRISCSPLTYNINKNCLEFDKIKEYHKKFQEKMILIETNNTKQVVSFNHDVLLGNVKVKAEKLLSYTSKEIEGINKLIRPTSFMQQEDYNIEDNWLRLITWVVCDGSLVDAHKNKPNRAPKQRVQFKLSREDKILKLEKLLSEMNISYTKQMATKSGINKLQPYLFRIYGESMRRIFNFFPEGKKFPAFFRFLSKRQLDVVLQEISNTDGTQKNERLLWYTNNSLNISILQEACIKNGYSLHIQRETKSGFKETYSYCCVITKNWDWVKLSNKISLVEYNDYSYCLTTNNGTLVTRIDGKCAITGNCWTRMYASKEYIEPEKKESEYNDFYIDSVINQLKFKQSQVDKKIRRNTQVMNELSNLFKEAQQENPGCKEVTYEFETINVPEKQKQLGMENTKLSKESDDLSKFASILSHEKYNSKGALLTTSMWYEEEFGENLSLNIKNLLKKKLNMEEVTFDNPIKSKEFLNNTVPQIKGIDKAELRQLCDRFIQMSYFNFNGSYFVVTHAGLPMVPDIFTPTQEMIKGVGKYEDHELIDATFEKNTPSNFYQIHGHRNSFNVPIKNGRTFNLEGDIEFGGHLRVLEILKNENDVKFVCTEIQNDIYKKEEPKKEFSEQSDLEILKDMLHSKLIQVKNLEDNIISLNFTREAFYDRKWNDLTCHARGLFVDKTNGTVVARSFTKFHNFREVPETETAGLKENFVFPVVGYKKENGFLGIVSKYKDKVRFFTKSSDSGDYVNWFIGALCENYGVQMLVPKGLLVDGMQYDTLSYTDAYNRMIKAQNEISSYTHNRKWEQPNDLDYDYIDSLKETVAWCSGVCNGLKESLADKLSPHLTEGYSYVFECVDPVNDPHIIKYEKPVVFLLEVFKNQLREEHCSWEDLISISDGLHVPLKQRELEFNTWEEFVEWKDKFTKDVTQWDCKHEGYVLEDANGFRVKFKSSFYKFWKQMRGVKDGIAGGRGNKKVYKTKEEIQVVKLLESIPREQLKEMSIIDIEEKFYEKYKG